MISTTLSSLTVGSTLKDMENSFKNLTDPSVTAPKKVKVSEENGPGNLFASSQNIMVTSSGYTVQEPNSLFAEIGLTNNVQETTQKIIARRGYEAALKIFQTQDRIAEYTLNIVA